MTKNFQRISIKFIPFNVPKAIIYLWIPIKFKNFVKHKHLAKSLADEWISGQIDLVRDLMYAIESYSNKNYFVTQVIKCSEKDIPTDDSVNEYKGFKYQIKPKKIKPTTVGKKIKKIVPNDNELIIKTSGKPYNISYSNLYNDIFTNAGELIDQLEDGTKLYLHNHAGEQIIRAFKEAHWNAGVADVKVYDAENVKDKSEIGLFTPVKGGLFIKGNKVYIVNIERTRQLEIDLDALTNQLNHLGFNGKQLNLLNILKLNSGK